MKHKYHTLKNIDEALKKTLEANSGWAPSNFLKFLRETEAVERENIVISTIEPE